MEEKVLKRVIDFCWDMLFPRFCLGCKKEGAYLCEDCLSLIDIAEHQYCPFCETLVFDGKTCFKCRKTRALDGLHFATYYESSLLKKTIHYFKYEPFAKGLGETLAHLIILYLLNLEPTLLKDITEEALLVPVPLYKKKLKWRGFNQSEKIAKELSVFLNLPLNPNILLRIKDTKPQISLNATERLENMKDCFKVNNKEEIRGKKILLIDDVFTTGSTMEQAASTLKQSGAAQVIGIVVAREKRKAYNV